MQSAQRSGVNLPPGLADSLADLLPAQPPPLRVALKDEQPRVSPKNSSSLTLRWTENPPSHWHPGRRLSLQSGSNPLDADESNYLYSEQGLTF